MAETCATCEHAVAVPGSDTEFRCHRFPSPSPAPDNDDLRFILVNAHERCAEFSPREVE